jgi:hypothetical protein
MLGLIDNQGNKVKFGDVSQTLPDQWSMPMPYIEALASTAVRDDYCDYSASELSSMTIQQYLLSQRNDIYLLPKQLLERWDGTIHHQALAPYGGRYAEVPLTMNLDGVTIGGTPDYYVDGVLWDYKTCKQYQPGWMDKNGSDFVNFESKREWYWQMNIYRLLLEHHGIPVKQMKVSMYIKDWSYRSKCEKIEIREVSFCNSIDEWITAKTRTLRSGQMVNCTTYERWKDNLRCKYYCDVSEICSQNPTHAF